MTIGKHSRRLQFVIPLEEARKIEREAKIMNKTISKYLKELFIRRRK